jgi:hypothetical protein
MATAGAMAQPSPGAVFFPAFPSFTEYRSIDGSGNNLANPDWGSVDEQLLRFVPPAYDDGVSSPSGANRPSAREISNLVVSQTPVFSAAGGATNMVWLWGQFIDHDVDLTDAQFAEVGGQTVCLEPFNIQVPLCDPQFDPTCTGSEEIDLCRSVFDPTTGNSFYNPRQQINQISTWIDASNVYGSDSLRADTLRTMDGTGRLKVTVDPNHGDLLPYNIYGLPNAGGAGDTGLFLSGDVRANEHIGLTSMHTLWMREHNFWAARIHQSLPYLSGDGIYELARSIVGAELQKITYYDFLTVLLGKNVPSGSNYSPYLNGGIANIFSTASYRFGHSMLTETLARLDDQLDPVPDGNISLANAFFAPEEITDVDSGGIEPLLRGAARQRANSVDPFLVDAVRNFLFGPPGAGGFDLASLNIQRGRDHGHPGYNDVRIAYGLPPKASIDAITKNPVIRQRLHAAYTNVNDIDPWIGGLAEPAYGGGLVGELVSTVLRDQFDRLRRGDRFWYENRFPDQWLKFFKGQTLASVIRRNTPIGGEIQNNVFLVP